MPRSARVTICVIPAPIAHRGAGITASRMTQAAVPDNCRCEDVLSSPGPGQVRSQLGSPKDATGPWALLSLLEARTRSTLFGGNLRGVVPAPEVSVCRVCRPARVRSHAHLRHRMMGHFEHLNVPAFEFDDVSGRVGDPAEVHEHDSCDSAELPGAR